MIFMAKPNRLFIGRLIVGLRVAQRQPTFSTEQISHLTAHRQKQRE